MIETIENTLQLMATGVCSAICFTMAHRMKEKEWDILALFYAAFFLGDLYWLLYLILNHTTPNMSYVSEFAWYAASMFLLILMRFAGGEETKTIYPIQWIAPPFVTGMCIFYMHWGDYLGNIIIALINGMLLWNSLNGIMEFRKSGNYDKRSRSRRDFYGAVLFFCIIEYTMWSVSCFWTGSGITNPYFWFDFMYTLCIVAFLPTFRKVVTT